MKSESLNSFFTLLALSHLQVAYISCHGPTLIKIKRDVEIECSKSNDTLVESHVEL